MEKQKIVELRIENFKRVTALVLHPNDDGVTTVAGLDFAALDADRAKVFDSRTIVNREVKRLEGELSGLPEHPDAPAEIVDVAALAEMADAAGIQLLVERVGEGDRMGVVIEDGAIVEAKVEAAE